MGSICLYLGNFAFIFINVAGAARRKYYDTIRYAIFSPIYWAFMSVGAWKGFLQLITKPHFWEKTKHGLMDEKEAQKVEEAEAEAAASAQADQSDSKGVG